MDSILHHIGGVHEIGAGSTIVGLDSTEVAPAQEGSEWDENVATRLLYKLIGWTLKSRR